MTAPPIFRSSDPQHRLTITLNERVFRTLDGMAREAGRTAAVQAQLLFDAAFSVRCKPTGDAALDAAVAAIDAPVRAHTGRLAERPAAAFRALLEAAEGATAPGGATLPEFVMPPEPKVLTAREAQHAAIVARAKMAVPATLDRLKDRPSPPPIKPEEPDHAEDDARPQPERSPPCPDPDSGEPAGENGSAAAAADPVPPPAAAAACEEPPVPREDGEPVADSPASPSAAPAAAPEAPLISAATLKYMRMLKSIGNSVPEIADMVGLPEADVRDVLAGKR